MSGTARNYVRVYYSVIDDPRFAGIYKNDRYFAAWVRLLLAADAMYPAPTPLPRWLRPAVLAALVACGLVDLTGGDHYRIHGLQTEREQRADAARTGANARWNATRSRDVAHGSRRNGDGLPEFRVQSEREPDEDASHPDVIPQAEPANASVAGSASAMQTHSERSANGMPSRAKQSKVEQSSTDAAADNNADEDLALSAYQAFVTYPGRRALAWLDDLVESYGDERVARTIGACGEGDASGLLARAKAALALEERNAERAEKVAERARLAEKRTPVRPAFMAEYAAAIKERYGEDL